MIDCRIIIKSEAKNRGITISKLAELMGVNRGLIFRYLNNPGSSIHSESLSKILDFCGYETVKKGK